jgi:polyisoprenyl-phosphate glycosyltransferase
MKKKKNKIKSLSLVIPCHNEQHIVSLTIKKYHKILQKLKNEKKISFFEIILVNNGSTDGTLSVLLAEKKKFPIKIINLKKNFGYTSSYLAGMFHSKKEIIITVSADMHEDPSKIVNLIKRHNETNRAVLGIYIKRHDKFLKNFFSKFYYKFTNLIKIPIIENHADFRLITKDINEKFFFNLPSFVFIRIEILKFIDKFEKIFYSGNDRKIGVSKFNFFSSSLLALDTILFYSKISIPSCFLILSLISIILLFFIFNTKIISLVLIPIIFFFFYILSKKRLYYLTIKKKHFIVKNEF